MRSSKLILISFLVVAAIQWYVPVSVIAERENILSAGKEYKFKTAPVDPNDLFRGKYISLSFAASSTVIKKGEQWQTNETLYVLLGTGSDGFSKINGVSKNKPGSNTEFVKAKVDYVLDDSALFISYPFEKFYMEESKAAGAETVYRQSVRDTSHQAYALVRIKNGEAVLKDVMMNNVSISKIVRDRQNQ